MSKIIKVRTGIRYFNNATFNAPLTVKIYGKPAPKSWWQRLMFVFRPYRISGGIWVVGCTFNKKSNLSLEEVKKGFRYESNKY